jgi:hypothetical protein
MLSVLVWDASTILTFLLLESGTGGVPALTGDGVARAGVAGDGLVTGCTTPSGFLIIMAALFFGGTMKFVFGTGLLAARLAV